MFAEISGTLDVDQRKLAMQTVQLEQPLLRTRIARDDGQHWFKSVPPEQAPLMLEVSLLCIWRLKVDAQLSTPFAGDAPLARFLWFGGSGCQSVAAMVFHHAIADGKSGMNVMIEVLRRAGGATGPLNLRRGQTSAQDLDLISHKGVIPGSLQKFKYWLSQGKTALMFARQLPDFDMALRPQRNIRAVPLSVPKKTAQALLVACRVHGTTVHGALGASQVLAVNREFGSAQARNLALNSLADLRGVLSGGLTAQDMGLYFADITTVHSMAVEPDSGSGGIRPARVHADEPRQD